MQIQNTNPDFRVSKYFFYIGIAFTVSLIVASISACKFIDFHGFSIIGATLLFPITFIFGDILTEVYGYSASRRIIWSAFAGLAFTSFWFYIVQILPAAPFWHHQEAYELILGNTPRVLTASLIAFFCGEFSNSYIMSKMKISQHGKDLWKRTIGSTLVGEGVDSFLFLNLAFLGIIPIVNIYETIITIYVFKVLIEVIFTPVTYFIVFKLKELEGMDIYDYGVDYNPFLIK